MQGAADVIFFNYQMMDLKGNVIESSEGQPVSIIQGQSQIFKALEEAVTELGPQQSKELTLPSKEAFGEHNSDLVVQVSKERFEDQPTVGDLYNLKLTDGSSVKMRVTGTEGDAYVLDGNHPLAGTDLKFQVEVVKKRPASATELQSGQVQAEN